MNVLTILGVLLIAVVAYGAFRVLKYVIYLGAVVGLMLEVLEAESETEDLKKVFKTLKEELKEREF